MFAVSLFFCLVQVDNNETACNTLRRNFPQSKVFTMPLVTFLVKLKSGRIKIDLSRIVLIHGSPPCQAFSRVNTSGGSDDVMNAECTLEFLELVKYVQPPLVTMENVLGITDDTTVHGTDSTKSSYLKRVVSELVGVGYSVRLCKLTSSDYGDPTRRERIVLFAAKKGYKLPSCPAPTHGSENSGLLPIVSCSDALNDLSEIQPVPDDGLVTLKDGCKVWGHFVERTELTEKHECYDRLKANEPAITIRKNNQVKHYLLNRFITILERARLMSFPDDYVFEGSHQDVRDQIGNAVPVKLAEAIGRAVMESYRAGKHSS